MVRYPRWGAKPPAFGSSTEPPIPNCYNFKGAMVLVNEQQTFKPMGWKLVGKRFDLIILFHDECSDYIDRMGSEKYKFYLKTLFGHTNKIEIRLNAPTPKI